jgi:hypothetical protein
VHEGAGGAGRVDREGGRCVHEGAGGRGRTACVELEPGSGLKGRRSWGKGQRHRRGSWRVGQFEPNSWGSGRCGHGVGLDGVVQGSWS